MTDPTTRTAAPPHRHRWAPTATVTGLTAVSVWILTMIPAWRFAGRFMVGIAVAYVAVTVAIEWVQYRTHTRLGSQPITAATGITIGRAWLCVLFGGFLFSAPPSDILVWSPAVLFALAAVLDAVDGAIARRTDSVTALGSRLDIEIDALLVLLGTAVVVTDGVAPTVFLAVGLARYGFVAGIWWRQLRGLEVVDLPASNWRRLIGAIIMTTVCLALAPIPGPWISWWIAAIVTVPALLHFTWDWLSVSGRVD